MKAEIFRTEKHTRNPWRVKLDGCILSFNFKTDIAARTFIVRTERLERRSTYDVLMERNAATDLHTRESLNMELTRRQDMAKYIAARARECAR